PPLCDRPCHGSCPRRPSHNRRTFWWDSTSDGCRPFVAVPAWERARAAGKVVIGRHDPGVAHRPRRGAFGSNRERARRLVTVSWSAGSTGASSPGLAATTNIGAPPARAARPAETQGEAGRLPFRPPSNGAEHRYATCSSYWQFIRTLQGSGVPYELIV